MINILFLGDVFGEPGRKIVARLVPQLREKHKLDLVCANAENATNGRGINSRDYQELMSSVDFLTSGNHIWHYDNIYSILSQNDSKLIRPANLPKGSPGRGLGIVETKSGVRIGVMNIMGRAFMNPPVECPFVCFDDLMMSFRDEADLFLLDMHAETTAEKRAMGWYTDGRVQACVGSHSHVQTSDDEILPQGSAYITDMGMCGPYNSVIGMNKEQAIKRFRTTLPVKWEVASDDVRLCGVIIEIDERAKKAVSIRRICEK